MTIDARLKQIERSLERIEKLVFIALKVETDNMSKLTALNAAIAENTDLVTSVRDMIFGLKETAAELQADLDEAIANGVDQAEIDAAQAAVDANNAILEAVTAIATGTPVEESIV